VRRQRLPLAPERLFDYSVRVSRARITLSVPPWSGNLDLWGRDVGGEWWALVIWTVHATPLDGRGPRTVWCAGWVLGRCVAQPLQPVEYLEVRRMQLGAEPAEWPAPVDRAGAHWRGYYLGILDGGEPQLPAEAGRPWGREQGSAYG
jgi:hypothetical protein